MNDDRDECYSLLNEQLDAKEAERNARDLKPRAFEPGWRNANRRRLALMAIAT